MLPKGWVGNRSSLWTPEHLLLLTHLLLPSLCCLIPFRKGRSLHCPWGQALIFLELSSNFADASL